MSRCAVSQDLGTSCRNATLHLVKAADDETPSIDQHGSALALVLVQYRTQLDELVQCCRCLLATLITPGKASLPELEPW